MSFIVLSSGSSHQEALPRTNLTVVNAQCLIICLCLAVLGASRGAQNALLGRGAAERKTVGGCIGGVPWSAKPASDR